MRTLLIILTMQLVAVAKIFLAYFNLREFSLYFKWMNWLMLIVYGIMLSTAFILFLKEQANGKNVRTA